MAYNEAKGEPGVGFDDGAGIVAAVVAPADEALVAFHILAEGVLAASKDDAHGAVGDGSELGRRAVAGSVVEVVGQCARERGVSCSTGGGTRAGLRSRTDETRELGLRNQRDEAENTVRGHTISAKQRHSRRFRNYRIGTDTRTIQVVVGLKANIVGDQQRASSGILAAN